MASLVFKELVLAAIEDSKDEFGIVNSDGSVFIDYDFTCQLIEGILPVSTADFVSRQNAIEHLTKRDPDTGYEAAEVIRSLPPLIFDL